MLCIYCAYNRPTKKEFHETIRRNHGNNIDASKCNYSANLVQKDKIELFCTIHKEYFSLDILKVLNGKGCPKCAQVNSRAVSGLIINEDYPANQQKMEICLDDRKNKTIIRFFIDEAIYDSQFKIIKSMVLEFCNIQKYELTSLDLFSGDTTIINDADFSVNGKYPHNENGQIIYRINEDKQFCCISTLTFLVTVENQDINPHVEYYDNVECWSSFYEDLVTYATLAEWCLVENQSSISEKINLQYSVA